MLEEIMNRQHLEKALLQVERNKGVGGIDGMQTDELRDYLNANYQALRQSVLTGSYEPSPVVSGCFFQQFVNIVKCFEFCY